MTRTRLHIGCALLAVTVALVHLPGLAHAQSSLGIGTNDAMPPATGLFAHQLAWINLKQQEFYRALAGAIKAMRQDGSRVWLLIGLSFAYGIFHAAGPGHGKAVISSYMVANEVALRRGVLLSFVSAFLQAVTAIVVMVLAWFVLRGTSVSMTDAAWFLEISSYVFVTAFGAWLLWKKAAPPLLRLLGGGTRTDGHYHADGSYCTQAHGRLRYAVPVASLQAAGEPGGKFSESPSPLWEGVRGGGNHPSQPFTADVCATCGHSHAPDPSMLSGDRFDWHTAAAAVAAVGIRPCSGALIVLSFALLNGLWMGGILSVLAMALGTAVTVSALAILAVTAKNWAVFFAGDGSWGARIHSIVEIGGAAFVFLFGLLLLSASLAA
ncbi:nickel/cobalt transporter [Aquamicrobium soli]|jgi:ABC-type nickel/cobalt efflux system permease component RcnA|uniref:Nickel/cobalt efflux system n=1 Tax=Aquamicrobium soli TaxID=1811518 RepID=A0ABV7K7B6_9HYPH